MKNNEKGSAIVITLMILTLLTAFVALAITRTTNETIAVSNDAAETRAFAAAQASLEIMTRNFDKIFEEKLSPEPIDLDNVRNTIPPGFTEYTFNQQITQTKASQVVDLTGSLLKGLKAIRDEWQLDTTVTEQSTGVQVNLRRWFYNNRIPLFQFGIFYNDDVEFHPGPRFDFGGRVHSNGNMFLMAGTGLYFSSAVTASGEIITDVARNWSPSSNWGNNVYIRNASGTYVHLQANMGSVLSSPANGAPVFSDPDFPVLYKNANWSSIKNLFQGNLDARVPQLHLPLIIASHGGLSYIELIKRGKQVGDLHNLSGSVVPVTTATADTQITAKERYANKKGIRISLSDSKARLPGCASGVGQQPVSTPCGVRLDGDASGQGAEPAPGQPRGYLPKPMRDGYQATRINGERFYIPGRETWIKIELVDYNPVTGSIQTTDVTEDILSFGVTERPQFASSIQGYGNADSRSIIRLQRFSIPGTQIMASDTNHYTFVNDAVISNQNVVVKQSSSNNGSTWTNVDNGFSDHTAHYKVVQGPSSGQLRRIVPFPIEMFDTREGLYNDSLTDANLNSLYPNGNVPWNGVMSMVEIDVGNLRSFLNGNFDNLTPNTGTPFATTMGRGLRASDVPQANGWVLYISDRRGDYDFDGQYDMEDVYGPNDGILQRGEDVNFDGVLQADYTNEAPRFTGTGSHVSPDIAALFEHSFYRRGVRLVNGQTIPGIYDSSNPYNTKGFTVASENAIYVQGNYNTTGVTAFGNPTPPSAYLPQNTANHIPASIVADAIIILSNNWLDSLSFRYPFQRSQRPATTTYMRFAMIAGDPISSRNQTPHQGGGDPRLAGGVHNFKRFLEDWSNARLCYTGSIINLYNSQNNNGPFKCCSRVYSPPTRDWTFDVSFLDPTRLPPGTPYIQNIQLTGFQRVN
ncbi:MAG: hypothetical protein RML33_04275 [Acidobacteriota bacterium]|nr:hypothetical protein [Pyrinomonadaceae bacterium]MDW8304032.1 hypothetical protein [Acidobacteriota bacterium]